MAASPSAITASLLGVCNLSPSVNMTLPAICFHKSTSHSVLPKSLLQADAGTTLTPMRTLEPPPLQHLYCGLPCPEWQSDHISLVTDFCVSRQSSKRSVMLKVGSWHDCIWQSALSQSNICGPACFSSAAAGHAVDVTALGKKV